MSTQAADAPVSTRGRGFGRFLAKVLAVIVLIVALLFSLGAWYFSGQIGADGLAVEPGTKTYTTTVVRCCSTVDETNSIWLKGDEPELKATGTFGLFWDGGSGVIESPTSKTPSDTEGVLRAFTAGDGGTPPKGTLTDVDDDVWTGTPKQALGLDYANVSIEGPLGAMPAYLIPGTGTTWAITVHGKGASRAEPYRLIQLLAKQDIPVLDISYRNDVGAPADPTNEYGYGLTEWADLDAAVEYALANGADKVVLNGWSMGGAIVGQFLANSTHSDKVSALILDSPALDLEAAIRLSADGRTLPGTSKPIPSILTTAAIWIADRRFPTHVLDANATAPVETFDGPVFIAHGTADETTPIEVSNDVVEARKAAGLTTRYLTVDGARHTESWNTDPERYDNAVQGFLCSVLRDPGTYPACPS